MNRVTINGDDFGMNESCSMAIAEAFSKELITDTTMLANFDYFGRAVGLAREQGFSDNIGVHLNLTSGVPLTEDIKDCPRFVTGGAFNKKYNRVLPLSKKEKAAIYKELSAQVKKIEDAGIVITHADSHHHIHTGVFVAPIAVRVCREHGICKMRLHRDLGQISPFKAFVKKRYNAWLRKQGFTTTEHFAYVMDIKDRDIPDSTEIMVHPDYDRNGVLVDRRGMDGEFPKGYPLPELKSGRDIILKGFAEL